MDRLIENISEVLGPKWVQLYFKLGLENTGRFTIQTRYQTLDVKTKHKNCARDTLVAWHQSRKTAKGLTTEKDKMKHLLVTLSGMDGFGEIAQKLGVENGVHIKLPPTVRPTSAERKLATTVKKTKTHSPSSTPPAQATTKIRKSKESVAASSASVSPKQSTANQDQIRSSHAAVATFVHGDSQSQQGTQHSTSSSLSGDSSPSESQGGHDRPHSISVMVESQPLFQASVPFHPHQSESTVVPINLNNTQHKYAILDAAQRIDKSCWKQIATNLDISERVIQTLAKERAIEERYYKTFKEWISLKGEGATFGVLVNVLETNSQTEAIEVLVSRLKSVLA